MAVSPHEASVPSAEILWYSKVTQDLIWLAIHNDPNFVPSEEKVEEARRIIDDPDLYFSEKGKPFREWDDILIRLQRAMDDDDLDAIRHACLDMLQAHFYHRFDIERVRHEVD
jgi:hypothetical protein